MTVRPIRQEESARAAEIEKNSLSLPWSERQIAEHARNGHGIYLVAEEDGVICGVCGAFAGAGECGVNNIAVDTAYRRRGIARALMRALMKEAAERGCNVIYLEVASRNGAAVSLYESLGFAPYAKRARFYGDDDAILMKAEVLC